MCPYLDNGCTLQDKYKDTELCQSKYTGCSGYCYAGIKGVKDMPQSAIDWAVWLREEG